MSKAIKLQDDTFLDSTSIVHKKVLLSEILETLNADDLTKVIGGISTDINRADLNDFTDKLIAGYGHNLTNSPLEDTPQGHLLSIPRHDAEGYVTQLFSPYPKGDLYIRQCVEGTWGAWTLVNPYKVGDIVITGANANPGDRYGGTWELIDKEFKAQYIYDQDSVYFTRGKVSAGNLRLDYTGHSITLNMGFTNSVQLNDTEVNIGTLKLSAMGVTALPHAYYTLGYTDGGNCVSMLTITSTGAISCVDVIPDSYIAVGGNNFFSVVFNFNKNQMSDDMCDKFYWKRIS